MKQLFITCSDRVLTNDERLAAWRLLIRRNGMDKMLAPNEKILINYRDHQDNRSSNANEAREKCGNR